MPRRARPQERKTPPDPKYGTKFTPRTLSAGGIATPVAGSSHAFVPGSGAIPIRRSAAPSTFGIRPSSASDTMARTALPDVNSFIGFESPTFADFGRHAAARRNHFAAATNAGRCRRGSPVVASWWNDSIEVESSRFAGFCMRALKSVPERAARS